MTLRTPSTVDECRRPPRQSRGRLLAAMIAVAWIVGWLPVSPALLAQQNPEQAPAARVEAAAQPGHAGAASAERGQAAPAEGRVAPAGAEKGAAGQAEGAGHGGEVEPEHAESIWAMVARLFNFALLAGSLVYLLRSPFMSYLEKRGVTIRGALTTAAALREDASAQLVAIDRKLKALPGEIEALKGRGAEEIAAEEARIHAAAAAERNRMLDQAKREIDTQVRVAERDLRKRTGELAVSVATERVKRTITDQDQVRLVDRYMTQVRQ